MSPGNWKISSFFVTAGVRRLKEGFLTAGILGRLGCVVGANSCSPSCGELPPILASSVPVSGS